MKQKKKGADQMHTSFSHMHKPSFPRDHVLWRHIKIANLKDTNNPYFHEKLLSKIPLNFQQIILSLSTTNHMSLVMRKPAFCIYKNKDADQLAVTTQLISAFVFTTRIVQFLYLLDPKFKACSHLLWLYSPVCVAPGRKP